ncbi:MAG: hypothetical protein ACU85V_01285 [Gammaproteobacteria bacterium]
MIHSGLRRSALLAGAVALGLGEATSADSILYEHSANGGVQTMSLSLGYVGPGSSLVTPVLPFGPDNAAIPSNGPTIELKLPGGMITELPPLGDPKDQATIAPSISFTFGSPVGAGSDDELVFSVDGDISAVNATSSAGDPLDAEIHYTGRFEFFLDTLVLPADSLVGQIEFDPLGPLDAWPGGAFEAVSLKVTEIDAAVPGSSTTVAFATAVVGAAVPMAPVPLYTNRGYFIDYSYDAVVPFGIDPHFATLDGLRFTAATPIPLPASALLLAPALLVLRRARRASAPA